MPAQHNASRLQTDCMVVVSGPMVRLPDSHLYALWPQLRVANPVIIQEETSTSLHCMMRTCHGCCCACFDLSQVPLHGAKVTQSILLWGCLRQSWHLHPLLCMRHSPTKGQSLEIRAGYKATVWLLMPAYLWGCHCRSHWHSF